MGERLYLRTHTGGKYVYRYIFQQSEELKIKHFATLDKEWLEFVKLNRTVGDIQHHYDVVIGPVRMIIPWKLYNFICPIS